MATWNDLAAYIRGKYTIAKEDEGIIALVFEVPGNRTQVVVVSRDRLNGSEEWAQIASPVALVGQVNLEEVLREVGGMVCGGLAIDGELLVLRDAVPLENLQINEFERPLELITTTADALEKKFVGSDEM